MEAEKTFFTKIEDAIDKAVQPIKKTLPHVARLCLISTFVEDGIRMCFRWGDQRDYIASAWKCGMVFGSLYVLISMVGQIGASIGIMLQKQVSAMCGCLLFVISLQSVAHNSFTDIYFLVRDLSLVGSIFLLLAENTTEEKSLFAGLPNVDAISNKPKAYIQLSGRVLLVFMFLHIFHFTFSPIDIIFNIWGLGCLICIVVGFRARLFASFLAMTLFAINLYFNQFWSYSGSMFDYLLFDFFQVMSVIGGLLFVIEKGPGDISYDEYKKSI